MASLFGKSALSPEWAERLTDIAKLNAYAQSTPVRLSSVVIAGYNLSGAKLSGAEFEKTEWKKVSLKSGEFTNTKFMHSSFEEVVFENVLFKDTVFEDSTFDASTFFQAELRNVRFVRCKFKNAGLESLKASTIGIEDSKLEDVSFFRSVVTVTVRDSKFGDVNMTGLAVPSALTFEKSELKEVDFSDSALEHFVLKEVTAQKSGIRNGRVGKIEIDGGEVAFGLSESSIEVITVRGARINALSMDGVKVSELSLSDCVSTKNIGLYQATVGIMKIERCPLNDFRPRSAVIEQWILKDSSLSNSKFEGMRAKEVTFENVTLGGTLNFSDVNIERLKSKNVTKQGGLEFIDARSNVKFE